jgi:ribosome-binding factor A
MSQPRTQRLESEIQRLLATLIARELKDPRVGNVTITAVSMAADMASARVFFAPFASSHPPDEVRTGLTHAAGFLRGELGRRLGLRYAPRLEFQFDNSAAAAARLSSLIDRAVASDRAGAAAPDAAHATPPSAASGAPPAAADVAPTQAAHAEHEARNPAPGDEPPPR